ncbi:MAG: histidine phosphatase family protein [Pseudomonadota bacterium]
MTTTFFLLRHAAHDDVGSYLAGRSEGIALGRAGLLQACRLADRMRRERFSAVVSSPRERTRQTAAAISLACEVGPVELCPDIDEIDFGTWSGKTFSELDNDPDWRKWNEERSHATTPSGETMTQVLGRARCCLLGLADRHAGEAVALVSHADVIKSVVCHVLGLPIDHCFRFDVAPASITTIVMGNWGAKLVQLNERVIDSD